MNPVASDRRRILITSVGSLVGQEVLEGLDHCRHRYFIVGLNSQADASSNFLCDRIYLGPELSQEEAYRERLASIVAAECPDLVIPARDDDVVWLAKWKEAAPSGTPVVLSGPAALAEVLRDKWLSCRFAREHHLPFVDTVCALDGWSAVREMARRHGWPLAAKPRTGNASRGVVVVFNVRELASAFSWPGYCFQPWLGARPDVSALRQALLGGVPLMWNLPDIQNVSLNGWIGPSGAPGGLHGTLHEQLKMGRSEKVTVDDRPQVQEVLSAYAQGLCRAGWRGPFDVQMGRDEAGMLQAFEINGRFTGSSACKRWMGLDFVGGTLDAFLGGRDSVLQMLPAPTFFSGPVRQTNKRLRSWPVSSEALESLQSQGVWDMPVPQTGLNAATSQ